MTKDVDAANDQAAASSHHSEVCVSLLTFCTFCNLNQCVVDFHYQILRPLKYSNLSPIIVTHHLRSAESGQLTVPHTKTNYGDRSFAVYGPVVWNSLPAELHLLDISLPVFRK